MRNEEIRLTRRVLRVAFFALFEDRSFLESTSSAARRLFMRWLLDSDWQRLDSRCASEVRKSSPAPTTTTSTEARGPLTVPTFAEPLQGEVPRTPIPRNQMNKGKKRGRGYPIRITPTRFRSATPAAMEQRSSIYVAARLLHEGFEAYPSPSTVIAIYLQSATFFEWIRVHSNP